VISALLIACTEYKKLANDSDISKVELEHDNAIDNYTGAIMRWYEPKR
jgi:hypothetical protein